MEKEQKWVIGIVVGLLAMAGIFFMLNKNVSVENGIEAPEATANSTSTAAVAARNAFGDYLKQQGVVFYGASWCPHCKRQKALLGEEVYRKIYVECSIDKPDGTQDEAPACKAANIQGFPTWVFKDGTHKEGEMTVADIKKLSGFTGDTGITEPKPDAPANPIAEPLPTK